MRSTDLDCVTIDAFGTLVALEDPTLALESGLRRHGVERSRQEIETAFRIEMEYYRGRSLEGRDDDSLARRRRDCCSVFLSALAVELEP